MEYKVKKAVVIGAGTMGAAIAAHLTNAGVPVTLLDIVPNELTEKEKEAGLSLDDPEVRNRIVRKGFEAAQKARPANFYKKENAALITLGNLEDDLQSVAEADWVIEAIIENLKIKQGLMERIDEVRGDYTIVSTNTSGISVNAIAEGRSEGFRKHFLGTHFFNPPRYLKLLEVIPGEDTLPEVVDFISHFAEYRLGKGVVLCKDTPNFIANRMGFASGAYALHKILEEGYTVKEIDSITGPLIGRPKTATFRLIDLVGIDVWQHVGNNLQEALPADDPAMPFLESEPVNDLIDFMVEKGWLGNKAEQGFYKKVTQEGEKEYWPLNLQTREYQPPDKPRFDSVKDAKDSENLGDRLRTMVEADDKAADFIRDLTYQTFSYASQSVPEIADIPKPIDDAMRWGFGHEAGPFQTWDMLGVEESLSEMEAAGFPPAPWVKEMVSAGFDSFYEYENKQPVGVYFPEKGEYVSLERSPHIILLEELKGQEENLVSRNPSATLVDLGDGVGCVEFHTKMNAIDEDTINMLNEALDRAEKGEFVGLVIGNDADNFSSGANLFGIVMAAQNEMWDQLEALVEKFQSVNMRMRYFHKPVVIAPAGLALGGGSEITMHGNRVVAAAELYAGLVEVGAGVIPAGGGTKEMVRRIITPPMRTDEVAPLPFHQKVFEQVGQGEVARSAEQARKFGILSPADRIVLNRSHLLAEAKREVLHMAETGFQPLRPEKVYAAGRDTLSALKVGLHMFKEGGYITEYETVIGGKLIYVLTGGDLSKPAWVDEQYFLDLEREAFMSLCGEKKSQERMWHLLRTGKVLRN
ncbi:MAG: 3-hydroxyacyl-CoA dehydrogenase NAD-binding domain-containing protein [Chloroflexota bacterium]